jgi:Pro-kumamolisin, activation domain
VFAPTRETIDAVKGWLASFGIGEDRISISKSSSWIRFNSTVGEAEELLQTKYKVSIPLFRNGGAMLTESRYMSIQKRKSLISHVMTTAFLSELSITSTSSRQPSGSMHTLKGQQRRFVLYRTEVLRQLPLSTSALL